jgi:SpoVK/Ycf46/Vps4 family AAA+-type ATPase
MLTTTAAVTNRDNCAGETMDLWGFALACMGYSGSDIVHVCKEATRLARMRSSLGLGSIRRLNPRADDKIESIAQRVMLSNADVWKAIRTTRPQSLGLERIHGLTNGIGRKMTSITTVKMNLVTLIWNRTRIKNA